MTARLVKLGTDVSDGGICHCGFGRRFRAMSSVDGEGGRLQPCWLRWIHSSTSLKSWDSFRRCSRPIRRLSASSGLKLKRWYLLATRGYLVGQSLGCSSDEASLDSTDANRPTLGSPPELEADHRVVVNTDERRPVDYASPDHAQVCLSVPCRARELAEQALVASVTS